MGAVLAAAINQTIFYSIVAGNDLGTTQDASIVSEAFKSNLQVNVLYFTIQPLFYFPALHSPTLTQIMTQALSLKSKALLSLVLYCNEEKCQKMFLLTSHCVQV